MQLDDLHDMPKPIFWKRKPKKQKKKNKIKQQKDKTKQNKTKKNNNNKKQTNKGDTICMTCQSLFSEKTKTKNKKTKETQFAWNGKAYFLETI